MDPARRRILEEPGPVITDGEPLALRFGRPAQAHSQ